MVETAADWTNTWRAMSKLKLSEDGKVCMASKEIVCLRLSSQFIEIIFKIIFDSYLNLDQAAS